MSKWKDISKIDAHIHLTPDDVIEANRGYDGKFIVNGAAIDYIEVMQKYNIEKFSLCHLMIPICFQWNSLWKQFIITF